MLPDSLRKEEDDLEFLRTYQEKIPAPILKEGKPFSL